MDQNQIDQMRHDLEFVNACINYPSTWHTNPTFQLRMNGIRDTYGGTENLPELAKRIRQRIDDAIPRCAQCGNQIASHLTGTLCAACTDVAVSSREMENELDEVETLDQLKDWIRTHIIG